MLKVQGHLGNDALPGDEAYAVPATPTYDLVGGMPLKRSASGLTPALSYKGTGADSHIVGLARYSERTILNDANDYYVSVKASYVRNAVGIIIGKGSDPQTQFEDATSPYDTTKTYAEDELLYIKDGEGIITNASGDAGSNPIVLGKVVEPPVDASAGDNMKIQIFGDLR